MANVKTIQTLLLPALRQYKHNNDEGFVFGYDKEEVEKIISALLIEDQRKKSHRKLEQFKDY